MKKLIQSEIDRRRETAGKTDPCERRKEILRSEQARLRNQMERLITAYQDGLLTLEQLRERMPNLKQQSQAVNSELQLLEMANLDQSRYLKLAESLGGFRNKLRAHAQTLDVKERQQILRLLVKEILVGFDTLTIRHSIPIPFDDGPPPNVPGSAPIRRPDYPLRPRRECAGACHRSEQARQHAQPGPFETAWCTCRCPHLCVLFQGAASTCAGDREPVGRDSRSRRKRSQVGQPLTSFCATRKRGGRRVRVRVQ